ncbi:MAG: PqqD family peptide modification chaperone [Microcystaceae cyanobacterium]
MSKFATNIRLMRRQDLLASDLSARETVMMDVDQGLYFGLEHVAKVIWDYLETPRTVADLSTYLSTTYEVDDQTLAIDLQAFLTEMTQHQLITWED